MTESDYSKYEKGQEELVNLLVQDHMGWAEAIARNVARAWSLDWQLDGLDGGAFEGLLFCARRYDPERGIPFRGYARKRIHEASTEQARISKSWKRSLSADTEGEQNAREISLRLFDIYPELRLGKLPTSDSGDSNEAFRNAIKQMLTSATVLMSSTERQSDNPETIAEYKELLGSIADMAPVHQNILWEVYYEGKSMRGVAEEWGLDELAVIREHREIISFMSALFSEKRPTKKTLKIRPGLRDLNAKFLSSNQPAPFSRFELAVLVIMILSNYVAQ